MNFIPEIRSPGERDPWLRLAAAVALRAFRDIKGDDLLSGLDAFCWLLDGGPVWMDHLDFSVGELEILRAAGGFEHGEKDRQKEPARHPV